MGVSPVGTWNVCRPRTICTQRDLTVERLQVEDEEEVTGQIIHSFRCGHVSVRTRGPSPTPILPYSVPSATYNVSCVSYWSLFVGLFGLPERSRERPAGVVSFLFSL